MGECTCIVYIVCVCVLLLLLILLRGVQFIVKENTSYSFLLLSDMRTYHCVQKNHFYTHSQYNIFHIYTIHTYMHVGTITHIYTHVHAHTHTHTHSFVVTGPLTHYLYQFLEAIVPRKTQLSSLRKVIIERLLFAPPYLLALFIIVALLEVCSTTLSCIHMHKYWSVLTIILLSDVHNLCGLVG